MKKNKQQFDAIARKVFPVCCGQRAQIEREMKRNFSMRKIGHYAALVVLVNHRRQKLGQTLNPDICAECLRSTLISGLSVWPDFGGGGSPKQLAPRSGQCSSLTKNSKNFSILFRQTSFCLRFPISDYFFQQTQFLFKLLRTASLKTDNTTAAPVISVFIS